MKLTSFYCAPVCSVSRAQAMTGCYGLRVSVPWVFWPGTAYGLSAREHTVADMLKSQGYTTMIVGKWHLGDQPPFLPTHHGFDHYFGLPYSNDMLRTSSERKASVVPLMRDDKVIELLTSEEEDQLVARYTEEALQFIRKNAKTPFFLYLPHTAVHVPIHPGKAFAGKSSNGRYGDWIEEMDWSTGQVLDTLRELKLDKNTLVMFSSDNGPWLAQKADGGEAGPLRGGKGSTFEGGMRDPTLAWWPGRIAPGSVSDAVTGNIDLLPTFVEASGGTVLSDRKIDGKSLLPLLLGQTKESPREAHFYFTARKLEAVRQGRWKLALGPQAEVNGTGKDADDAKAPGVRLYDLDADIGERNNVAPQHPDIVEKLKNLAKPMSAALCEGKTEVRPAGKVDSPSMLYASPEPPHENPPKK
jgi:arylsulfatase A-like enzyme